MKVVVKIRNLTFLVVTIFSYLEILFKHFFQNKIERNQLYLF